MRILKGYLLLKLLNSYFVVSSKAFLHTSVTFKPLEPWFVTGFTDGEGCFWINVYKDDTYKTGWRVKLFYQIDLHRKDQALLEQIKKIFNVGYIYNSSTVSRYYVTSVEDLQVISEHFKNI